MLDMVLREARVETKALESERQADVAVHSDITVIVADDHPLLRESLLSFLGRRFRFAEVLEVGTYPDLAQLASQVKSDLLIITDLVMPGMRGLQSLADIRSAARHARIVVYSSIASPSLAEACLQQGANAVVGKRVERDAFSAALATVLSGGSTTVIPEEGSSMSRDILDRATAVVQLSPQQTRVFQMLGDGLLNKQIAYNLGISEATVKAHVGRILEVLGVSSRSKAAICAAWMQEHGLL